MKAKNILLVTALILALLVGGMVWMLTQYHMVELKFYPKDAAVLDLREEEITIKHFDKLREKLPYARILWNVPFQGKSYDCETRELTVTALTDGDVKTLGYFTKLETLEASACRDYAQLLLLSQSRPEVRVNYQMVLGGNGYDPKTEDLVVTAISQEEISRLQYLPNLKTVAIGGGVDAGAYAQLEAFCKEQGYEFLIRLGETSVKPDVQELTVSGVREEDLSVIPFLTQLKTLHLDAPEAPAQSLVDLQSSRPELALTWTRTVAGKSFHSSDDLIDISGIQVTDLSAIEEEMTYFPNATQLEMHLCGVENEDMAAFREKVRQEYKVVWTVYLGDKLPTRTDVTNIMPARDGVSNFHDAEAYNMRYCEDVIAIDIGHLDVRNIDFVAFMPKLKYLILSWTGVSDISPISNCKELVFFEATDATIGDLTPLKGCTALEDINISGSGAKNIEALLELPNLKNVWVIFRSDLGWKVTQARPEVYVRSSGDYTVSGWRSIPNYFAMRDALGMFYMNG